MAARGLVNGSLSLLAADVVYLRGGLPAVYGRNAVRTVLSAPDIGGDAIAQSWQPLGGGVSYDLRSAYTFGVAVYARPQSRRVQVDRYIAFWHRDPRQPWRIAAYAEIGPETASETSFTADQLTPPTRTMSRDLADATAHMRAADSSFADLADRMGVAYAFSNTVAPDGMVFGNPQLVIGPVAVNKYYLAHGGGSSLTWHPVYASVAGSNDLGFSVGEYVVTGRGPTGAAVQRFGKYLTVWERQVDGTWKFVVDGGNETPARVDR